MLTKYAPAFRRKSEPPELPPRRDVEHTIPLKNTSVRQKPIVYPVAEKHISKFTEEYNKRVKAGFWEPVSTANASPMMIVGKRDSEDIRIVVDTKERNRNTEKHVSLLPRIKSIINMVASRRYHSSFDVSGAFEQVRVADGDETYNALSTIFGTVESSVAIQGDLNSPNSCRRMMNHIYCNQIGRSLLVYIDDFFIMSDSWDGHKRDTEEILKTTVENPIKLARHKWQLIPKEVSPLGRRIDVEGIKLDPSHVKGLLDYPRPAHKKEVERWCGVLAWWEMDVPKVARINAPISALKGKGEFHWSSACEAAFQDLKTLIQDSVENNQKRVAMRQKEIAHPSTRPIHAGGGGSKNDHPGKHLFLVTDGSVSGYDGGLFLGESWWTARPLGFFSKI